MFINEKNAENITVQEVKTALEHGADVNYKDKNNWTPFLFALRFSKDPKVIEFLLNHGADVHYKDDLQDSALVFASRNNPNPAVIEVLLKHGANIHYKGGFYNRTPLLDASKYNPNPKVIEMLLKYGANIHDRQDKPIKDASRNNPNPEVIEMLLKHGADIHVKDYDNSLLMLAIGYNPNQKVMEMLLKHGLDINYQSKTTKSPLGMAVDGMNGITTDESVKRIKFLINHGAKVSQALLKYVTLMCDDPKIFALFKKYHYDRFKPKDTYYTLP